jgi:hypothetical protein
MQLRGCKGRTFIIRMNCPRLYTAEAWVQPRVMHVEYLVDKGVLGHDFLRTLCFPLPMFHTHLSSGADAIGSLAAVVSGDAILPTLTTEQSALGSSLTAISHHWMFCSPRSALSMRSRQEFMQMWQAKRRSVKANESNTTERGLLVVFPYWKQTSQQLF